jgi:Arc/MetJ-type ribon-helix-helix transcriptional regulator
MKAEKKKRIPMVNITINIPDAYDNAIQSFIKKKVVQNRSQCIRKSLEGFLNKELEIFYKLNTMVVF